jgi:CheY-like chemotaxis protein
MIKAETIQLNEQFSLESGRHLGESLVEKLGEPPDACWLFCSPEKMLDDLVKGVFEAIGKRALIGCTTAGEISTDGFSVGSAVLGGIVSDQIDFEMVACHDISRDSEKAGQKIAKSFSNSVRYVQLFSDGITGNGSAILRGMSSVFPTEIPVSGGPSGDAGKFLKKGGCFIEGKPSEIFEVLVNLVKNALEAMPHGGALTLGTYSNEEHVYLRIEDTGEGIPEAYFQRIFEPFFTTKGNRSSGLGLSSCYGIVKKNNGEIQVDSQLDQGTKFVIRFPKAQPHLSPERKNSAIGENDDSIRFLFIDDEINILKAMEMYFENTEIDITTAQTTEDALMAIESNHFDAILCDLSMNDMNGLEVGKWVVKHCQDKRMPKIPFLLYTGLDKQLDTEKLQQSGIDRLVNKPTPCQDIYHIIKEHVIINENSPLPTR